MTEEAEFIQFVNSSLKNPRLVAGGVSIGGRRSSKPGGDIMDVSKKVGYQAIHGEKVQGKISKRKELVRLLCGGGRR